MDVRCKLLILMQPAPAHPRALSVETAFSRVLLRRTSSSSLRGNGCLGLQECARTMYLLSAGIPIRPEERADEPILGTGYVVCGASLDLAQDAPALPGFSAYGNPTAGATTRRNPLKRQASFNTACSRNRKANPRLLGRLLAWANFPRVQRSNAPQNYSHTSRMLVRDWRRLWRLSPTRRPNRGQQQGTRLKQELVFALCLMRR
jgi:hypothetical protein